MNAAAPSSSAMFAKMRWVAERYAIAVALVGSLLVHTVVYWSSSPFVEAFTRFSPKQPIQYDATLTPIETTATFVTKTSVIKAATPEAKPGATRGENRRTRSTAKSAANFVAPENAIAVAPSSPAANSTEPSLPIDDPLTQATGTGTGSALPLPATETAVAPVTEAPIDRKIIEVPPAATRLAPAFAERISIEYKLSTAITDGVANFRWTRKGTDYEIESSIQATGFLVSAFAGVIHQQSRGIITDDGLRPQQFSIRRGEGEAETAEFKRDSNSLAMKRNGETRSVPLTRDMQDMQSFLFQLAYDAPQLADTAEKLDVLVTNARKVYRYQFRKMGMERLETRFGPVDTIRLLSEAPNPEDQYEVWLAPSYFYLPIKLKYYLGRFPVEQLATRLGVSGETPTR
jgi:hypothetical protein